MRTKTVERLLKSTPRDIEIFVDLYADLVVRIEQILREQDISQKDLAVRLGKSPSEISKWLNGDHNFTLKSLARLSAELGQPLLEVPSKKDALTFVEDGYICRFHTFVTYQKPALAQSAKVWQLVERTYEHNDWSNAG